MILKRLARGLPQWAPGQATMHVHATVETSRKAVRHLVDRDRLALELTKLAILVTLAGFAVVGKSTAGWPVITWPMYSNRTSLAPPLVTLEVELRIIEESGRTHRLSPVEIFPKGRQEVAERVINEAFHPSIPGPRREALHRYLTRLVRGRLPDSGALTIEGWRTEWIVAPLELPPLDLASPSVRVKIGSFVVNAK